jgi:hypothetical protein
LKTLDSVTLSLFERGHWNYYTGRQTENMAPKVTVDDLLARNKCVNSSAVKDSD